MENEYTFDKGTHYSRGQKGQPAYIALGLIALGIILHCIHGVSIWYSLTLYAAAVIAGFVTYRSMVMTHMRVVFDSSCLYTVEGPDKHDINKLFGVGFGDHSRYSGRFGWVGTPTEIKLYAYTHDAGSTSWEHMMSCLPNEPIDLQLKLGDTDYEYTAFRRDGERARTKHAKNVPWLYKFVPYKLFPYFGGNLTAPHQMKLGMTHVQ